MLYLYIHQFNCKPLIKTYKEIRRIFSNACQSKFIYFTGFSIPKIEIIYLNSLRTEIARRVCKSAIGRRIKNKKDTVFHIKIIKQ